MYLALGPCLKCPFKVDLSESRSKRNRSIVSVCCILLLSVRCRPPALCSTLAFTSCRRPRAWLWGLPPSALICWLLRCRWASSCLLFVLSVGHLRHHWTPAFCPDHTFYDSLSTFRGWGRGFTPHWDSWVSRIHTGIPGGGLIHTLASWWCLTHCLYF